MLRYLALPTGRMAHAVPQSHGPIPGGGQVPALCGTAPDVTDAWTPAGRRNPCPKCAERVCDYCLGDGRLSTSLRLALVPCVKCGGAGYLRKTY
jgi:hypothetical protein